MVKSHKRRSSSVDIDSDDSFHKKKRKKHHHHRSRSRERVHRKSQRDRSESPVYVKRHIKQEPDSDSEERHRKHRIKHEVKSEYEDHRRDYRDHRGGRDNRNSNRPVRVKQEPTDEENFARQNAERRRNNERREMDRERKNRIPEDQRYGRPEENTEEPAAPKDAPNFELSGKLTEDTNTYKGIVIKYNEPPEARKPKKRWRLYPFKNDEALKPFHMHRQSAYLFGRERIIADIPIDHPSCSKQHAVFQYRLVPYEKEDGRRAHKIAPYIIDLGSANGTFVNNKKIEAERYVELLEKDVIKFGFSSREYVLLHDRSDTREVGESPE